MLDIHAVSSGGGTSLTAISTILAGTDGAVTAGVPINSTIGLAQLVGYGAATTIADTIKELRFNSPDLVDNQNGLDDVSGGTATGIEHNHTLITYNGGQRALTMSQNTGSNNNMGWFIDNYPASVAPSNNTPGNTIGPSPWAYPVPATYSQVFSGALTAITWGSQAISPTNNPPVGRYAILGAKVSSLTNYGLIRFQHTDFGAFLPGFPVTDPNITVARAVVPGAGGDLLMTYAGRQFTYLSQILGVPCEPVFTAGQGALGLKVQVAAITADTPQVTVFLRKIG